MRATDVVGASVVTRCSYHAATGRGLRFMFQLICTHVRCSLSGILIGRGVHASVMGALWALSIRHRGLSSCVWNIAAALLHRRGDDARG